MDMNSIIMEEYKRIENFLETLTFNELSKMKVSSVYEFILGRLTHAVQTETKEPTGNTEISIDIRNDKIIITGYVHWRSTVPGEYKGGFMNIDKEILKEG